MILAADARDVVTVSELARALQSTLDRHHRQVWVAGEVSNVRPAASGHVYFVLKDDEAQVAAVAFRSVASRLRFRLEDGLEVVVGGRVGLYAVRGALQLYADAVEPLGAGALAVAFEQLKARLEAEGAFAPGRKRPLPRFPAVVGLVTSPRGAAIRDVCRVLRERWPLARVVVAPTVVQGAEAAPAVAEAIDAIGARAEVDVVVVARGGGSIEDLWAFNTEEVARALLRCPIPTIAGVGHEHDVTIADLVADARGSTPTAAATLAVPDRREMAALVNAYAGRLGHGVRRRLAHDRLRLGALARAVGSPRRRLQDTAIRVDELATRLRRGLVRRAEWERRVLRTLGARVQVALARGVTRETRARLADLGGRLRRATSGEVQRTRARLDATAGKLSVLSPLASLGRGYAIVRRTGGGIVRRATSVDVGERLEVLLGEGRLRVRVEAREEVRRGKA